MSHALLIVDDEPKIFQALRRTLHREPYEILYADSGEKALEVLSRREIEVLIADENMPGMKGNVLLARCKQQWPEMVRMMLTGDARIETIVAAVNRGEIFRFFIKPCNEAELIVSIRDGLQMRALKIAAAQLLSTVKKQGETIRLMNGLDGSLASGSAAEAAVPARAGRVLGGTSATPSDFAGGSGLTGKSPAGGGEPPGTPAQERSGVFHLQSKDMPEDVDALLNEIRSELEKFKD